ncbi:hypothetical protein [Streptomyces sp. NPDC048611]|uniref:hypothetical protein n=1 Tax=unclassified Streptomyces TaxID=2593676 RepID=UPI0034130E2A
MSVDAAGRRAGTGEPGEETERADGACRCGRCPHGARAGHQQAVAAFVALREDFAAGRGVPAGLARSAGAARQWVSDELTLSAREVAQRRGAGKAAWLTALRGRTLLAVWGAVVALLLGQALTALGTGWTAARTAGLLAAVVLALALTAAAWRHRAHGGALAPLIGEDGRLSTSRTVAAAWVTAVLYTVLTVAVRQLTAAAPGERHALFQGLALERSAALLVALAAGCAVAVAAHALVASRVRAGRLQKVPADRPRAADLLTDDAGRGSLLDVQYVLVHTAVLGCALARLAGRPDQAPQLPWGLVVLLALSGATYLAGKAISGGPPVILSVVRSRELGDLAAPVRTGDDIEIRGAGFVPPGAATPDRLARTVVRIGDVHVPVPLVPVAGGFANPTDGVLTVPVPVDVEPGRVEVRVVTAAGVETDGYPIDVLD